MQPRQPEPWVVPDLFRWFLLLGVGAVGLVTSWWGASGTARTSGLITWTNVGVAAVVVSGVGNMTWLVQGRRAVAARRRALLGVPTASSPGPVGADPASVRVAVAGTRHHHRPGCPAVAGKPVEEMPRADHERSGRRPCGLCDG